MINAERSPLFSNHSIAYWALQIFNCFDASFGFDKGILQQAVFTAEYVISCALQRDDERKFFGKAGLEYESFENNKHLQKHNTA